MSNTFGNVFRLTTFGESHGVAIGGVVDGCPAGVPVNTDFIATEMLRRHVGKDATSRREPDNVSLLSGVKDGLTLGTPIGFVIGNSDQHSEDYDALAALCRPGHADYTYMLRYGLRDHRGGGRASGRETAARVVGGSIAKSFLLQKGITIQAREVSPTASAQRGGVIECVVDNMVGGCGDPVFDKLNARLAYAMMSIPSAIGFEMGAGFAAAAWSGLEYRDEWCDPVDAAAHTVTVSNHCGGVQGGISNGMPLVFRVAFHAPTTVGGPTSCCDASGHIVSVDIQGRHDGCHIPRTVVVVEAMAALTIADVLVTR